MRRSRVRSPLKDLFFKIIFNNYFSTKKVLAGVGWAGSLRVGVMVLRSEAKRFFGARRNDARRNDGRCVLKIENGEQSKIWVTGHPKIGQFSVPKTPLQMAILLADKWKKTSRNRLTRRQKKTVLPGVARSGRSVGRSVGRPVRTH